MAYATRILIIEDEPSVRGLFETVLAEAGYAVSTVQTARHAMYMVRDTVFDLAIVDMSLPDGDGPDVIRDLLAEAPYLRVLAGSGGMGPQLGSMALRAGAAATFIKPITPKHLRYAVDKALDPESSRLAS